MPKKGHRKHRSHNSEEGFVSDVPRSTMNKNEKIIMGVLIGGIVLFLVLSIFLLFQKNKEAGTTQEPVSTIVPTVKKAIVTTPYPTVPPITDFTMQVNENRFYPDTVNITHGHAVTIINIGQNDTVITPIDTNNKVNFGEIKQGEQKSIKFDQPGVYKYKRNIKPDQTLTITVK